MSVVVCGCCRKRTIVEDAFPELCPHCGAQPSHLHRRDPDAPASTYHFTKMDVKFLRALRVSAE